MNVPHFPAYAIPGLMGDVLNERASSPKDNALVGGLLQGTGALVTQGVALVKGHDGAVNNLSCHVQITAPTGSGKSYHFIPLTKPIEDGILACQEQFPKHAVQLFSDATPPAMGKPMSENPVAGWMTDEAGYALQNMKPGHYPLLTSYQDGRLIQRYRVAESTKATRPFFTIVHLLQDTVADEIRQRHGKISQGCGYDARTRLVVVPPEWVGQEDIAQIADCNSPISQRHATRIHELLNVTTANMQSGMQNLPVNESLPEAQRELQAIQRDCQERMQDPAYVRCVDVLAKYVAHVTKLAASWHVFENRVGGISREYVERAAQVIEYHLNCWLYERSRHQRERREVADAKALYQYAIHTLGRRVIPHNELRLLAVNIGLGSSARRDNALSVLYEHGYAAVDGRGVIKFFPDTRWVERVLNRQALRLYR